MSFNLVELVKDQISGQVLGQISNAVGENAEATKSVVDSAIPALLGGLMDKASSNEGASALFETIKNQDDSILDNLSGIVGGSEKDSLIKGGSDMLGSLFGGSAASGLLSAVSGASGASQGAVGSIMGMVSPMIMSTVKRYMSGGGEMNQAGLASMLMSQKDNIAGAMPSGLADQLGSSGFLSNVGDLFGGAGAATAATNVAGVAEGGASWVKKLIPIAALAVLAFLALKFFGGKTDAPEVSTAAPAVSVEAPVVEAPEVKADASAASSLASAAVEMVKGGDVTAELKGLFSSAQESLGGITDVDSATAALPKLTDFSGKLDGITAMVDTLPEAAKPIFNTVVQGGLGQIQPMLDKVMAIPGVGEILGGVIEPIKEKLSALGE